MIRIQHNVKDFFMMPNSIVGSVSANALEIYCYLRSKPSNWQVYNAHIMKSLDIKKDKTIAKYLKELIEKGWIAREKIRDKFGKLTGNYVYTLNNSSCIITENKELKEEEIEKDLEENTQLPQKGSSDNNPTAPTGQLGVNAIKTQPEQDVKPDSPNCPKRAVPQKGSHNNTESDNNTNLKKQTHNSLLLSSEKNTQENEVSESEKVVCVFVDDFVKLHENIQSIFSEITLTDTTIKEINALYEKTDIVHMKALYLDAKENSTNADSYIYNMLSKQKNWYEINQASYIKHLYETQKQHEQDESMKNRYSNLVNEFESQSADKIEQLKIWLKNKAEKWLDVKQQNVPQLVKDYNKFDDYILALENKKQSFISKIFEENNYLMWSWLVLHENYEEQFCSDRFFNKNIVEFVKQLKSA